MAELLSMALLSTEPVASAKPQASATASSAATSSTEAVDSEQSFAQTLAAEVNAKATEKTTKAATKARQNTATDKSETQLQQSSTEETKQSAGDVKAHEQSQVLQQNSAEPAKQQANEAIAVSAEAIEEQTALQSATAETESENTEQSNWLSLLDKAKSLHERLSKKINPEPQQATKAATDKATLNETAANELSQEKPAEAETVAEVKAGAALATTAQQGKAELVQPGGKAAVLLPEQLKTEATAAQSLSADEADAIKQLKQLQSAATTVVEEKSEHKRLPEKEQAQKYGSELAYSGTKQAAESKVAQAKMTAEPQSEAALQAQTAEQKIGQSNPANTLELRNEAARSAISIAAAEQQAAVLKDLSAEAKSLKAAVSFSQTPSVAPDESVEQTVMTTAKSPLQTELPAVPAKVVLPAAASKVAEPVLSQEQTEAQQVLSGTDAKLTVQAQSAAALVAPAVQAPKGQNSEVKISTEEALKQVAASAVQTQAEQGGSSASSDGAGHQSAQQSATLLATQSPESAKTLQSAESASNSFSNQLKTSQDKITTAAPVSARDWSSEQKQLDPLGQKLNLIQPEASNQLKEKMLMMVKDKVHTAEIRLDPSELGSMQIKINLQQDQMSVQFMVQQGSAKELMEQQMPKLKELLQQQGIELSQGSVQQQNQSSSGQEGGRRTASGHGRGTVGDDSDELPALAQPRKNSDRVVDYYA